MKQRLTPLLIGRLLVLAGVLAGSPARAQKLTEASYNLDFVAGRYEETTGDILLVFRYEPKPGQEYKPIFSMRFAYSLGPDGPEQQVLFGSPNRHSIVAYGPDLGSKNPALYQWLKNKVNFNHQAHFMLACFYLRGLADHYYPSMTYTYGLWEPKNTNLRFERRYQVALENQ